LHATLEYNRPRVEPERTSHLRHPPAGQPTPMNIFANTVVTLTFQLYDSDDTLLEETPEPIEYLHGGYSAMPPKLEESLDHKKPGDVVSLTLEPVDAFGEYDPDLVKVEPLDRLPADVEQGMMFETYAGDDDQQGDSTVFTVTDIAEGKAVLDGNHAWAGKRVRFECKVLDVRPATAEEIGHGHVHGAHGHHHH
jgi:FKBP-type peptidyl-prolyl cis-trans isomerase SlyD